MTEIPSTPPMTDDLPGIGGVVKQTPETFVVEEIPAYLPCGEGEHLYLWVEKRDVSAGALIDIIAKHFKVSRRDIGTAGNKDRRAVTRQWVSVTTKAQGKPGEIAPGVTILEVSRHRNKLKTNHLIGNRFELEVHEVDTTDALSRSRLILERLEARGTPNYFGTQRFGREGSTLAMGLSLLNGAEPQKLRRNKRLKRLAASAAQSAVFNEVLRRRLLAGTLGTALGGDRLNRVGQRGQLFITPETLAEGQAGLDEGTLVPTGPMWGPSMFEVAGEVLELETNALTQFGLTPAHFERHKKLTPGTRRDLLVRFLEAPHSREIDNGVRVGFSLPSGAYATVVLAELTKSDFSAWEAP